MYFCQKLGFNDMIHIEHFTFNAFQTRCNVVWDSEGLCAFVDPGCSSQAELSKLTDFVSSRGLRPVCIMLTHAHFDHIYGTDSLSGFYGGLPVYMHPEEKYTLENTNPFVCKLFGLPLPEIDFARSLLDGTSDTESVLRTVTGGDVIEVGSLRFNVVETPGHTCGGVCFFEDTERIMFTGDTLFAGAIGRTDHPGGDYDKLIRSIIENVLPLDAPKTSAAGGQTTAHASGADDHATAQGSSADGSIPQQISGADGQTTAHAFDADSQATGHAFGTDVHAAGQASGADGQTTAQGSGTGAPAARHTSVTIIPGHGPCSDLATEGMTNPFLLPFNEPYDD